MVTHKAFFNTLIYGLIFMLMPGFVLAQDKKLSAEEYIEQYKDLAIREMMRSGVPASITLAQGLLESGNGNSKLAKEANNHFGIKCKKEWIGKTISIDDDAPQECFRVYETAESSYVDHSDFLMNNTRYAPLFELEPTDYVGWANGLKSAGYATNPRYPELLISAIEKYSLYQYDVGNTKKPKPEEYKEKYFAQKKQPDANITNYNDKPVYIVKQGDSYFSIAKGNKMMPWQIKKYNDLESTDPLQPGTVLYLKPKNRKGKDDFHVMAKGESMYYISQKHAVKLKQLYKWNRMQAGQEPATGEVVYLRKKRTAPPKLQNGSSIAAYKQGVTVGSAGIQEKQKQPEPKKEELIAENNKKQSGPKTEELKVDSKYRVKEKVTVNTGGNDNAVASADTNTKAIYATGEKFFIPDDNTFYSEFHTVRDGETIDKLAMRYGTTKKEIQQWNEMNDEVIYTGQLLRVRSKKSAPVENIKSKEVKKEEEEFFDDNNFNFDAENTAIDDNKTVVDESVIYTVKPGETLYAISRKLNIPVADLKAWNKLEDGGLKVGQKLKVKGEIPTEVQPNTEIVQIHVVQQGETLYSISRKYNLTVDKLKELNNISQNSLNVGQRLKIAE